LLKHKTQLDNSLVVWAGPDVKVKSEQTGLVAPRIGIMPLWSNHKTAYFQSKQFNGLGFDIAKGFNVLGKDITVKLGGVSTSRISKAIDFTALSLAYNIGGRKNDLGRIGASYYAPLDVILDTVQRGAEKNIEKVASKELAEALMDVLNQTNNPLVVDINAQSAEPIAQTKEDSKAVTKTEEKKEEDK